MAESTYKRATICAAVDDPRELAAVREWLGRWRASLRHCEENGCGCCVEMYDVSAPAEALAELPEALLAGGAWTRSG